jgi:hypothetical protein
MLQYESILCEHDRTEVLKIAFCFCVSEISNFTVKVLSIFITDGNIFIIDDNPVTFNTVDFIKRYNV